MVTRRGGEERGRRGGEREERREVSWKCEATTTKEVELRGGKARRGGATPVGILLRFGMELLCWTARNDWKGEGLLGLRVMTHWTECRRCQSLRLTGTQNVVKASHQGLYWDWVKGLDGRT